MPDDAIVVVDTGHAGMWMGGMYDLRTPTQSYMRSAGHLGWAFPRRHRRQGGVPGAAGRGVHRRCRLLVPHRRDRDGGALEASTPSPSSTTTAAATSRKRGFDRAYGGKQTEQARELWTYNKMNFAKLAEDMGALGIRVEQPADFAPALARRSPPTGRP